jgi:hypothetical protein
VPAAKCCGCLRLAGGKLCKELDGGDLFRKLVQLGVPGVAATDGHQFLCDAYGRFLQAKAAAAAAEYLDK